MEAYRWKKKNLLLLLVLPLLLAVLTGTVQGETRRIVLDPPPTLVGGMEIIECPTCGTILGTQEHFWTVSGDGSNPHTPDGYTYTYDYTLRSEEPCPKCAATAAVAGGAWVLQETETFWKRDGEGWIERPEGDVLETAYNGGTHGTGYRDTHRVSYENNRLAVEGHYIVLTAPGRLGERQVLVYDASLSVSAENAPSSIAPGERVEIQASGSRTSRILESEEGYTDGEPAGKVTMYFSNESKGNYIGSLFAPLNEQVADNYDHSILIGKTIPENSATFSATAPEYRPELNDLYLTVLQEVLPSYGWVQVYKEYHYVWSQDGIAAIPPAARDPLDPVEQVEDRGPSDVSGEDVTDIKTAAVVGVAAAVAALAGAGASLGGGEAAPKEDPRQKKGDYRMVVHKTFGDTIVHGKTDQFIAARIESRNGQTGAWAFDAARTGALSATLTQAQGLGLYPPPSIPPAPGKGNVIMLSNESPTETQATMTFTFAAPDGGFFQRKMTFKLEGAPAIQLESDKVWFLEGDYAPFELKCRLVGYDASKHNIVLDGMDRDIRLEMAKDAQGEDVVRITPASGVFDHWDKQAFVYPYPCSIAYEDKTTFEKTAKADFVVNLCHEGIGLATKHVEKVTKIDELPEKLELYAFTEAESFRRTEKMVRLPLTVARWDDKGRRLEYDTDAAGTLQLEYTVDLHSDQLKTTAAQMEAIRAMKDARLRTTPVHERDLQYHAEMKPAVFGTITTGETEPGMAPFPILLTISLPGGRYPALVLKGSFNPVCDWEKIVRWFFDYPSGTFAATQMKVGDPEVYVEGLQFIENRVFSFKNVPFGTTTDQNHYEDGVIASTTHKRVRSVVLRDSDIPTGIGDYMKAQSLVHELTHAVEHKKMGSAWTMVAGKAGHERHAYFLQYASDAMRELALAERGVDVEDNVSTAIASMHRVYNTPNNTEEPRKLSWFGSRIPTQHELFQTYVEEWLQMGSGMAAGRVGEVLSRMYYPGALKNSTRNYPAAFEVQTGPLKGSKFLLSWGNGSLGKFTVLHKDYQFNVIRPLRWTGGLSLQATLEVVDKLTLGGMGTGSAKRGRDTFKVTLTAAETLAADRPEYPVVSGFSAQWKLEGGNDEHSIAAPAVRNGQMTTALVKTDNDTLKFD
ncbi:hypothetical protein [Anaerotalea alkaliphila]|uniref:Uncharacterized protein n=1 Tax=Anaerotalea alkaliphila TaxID=2662126 RepID=A0A7X5KLK2_9FIRM|nr:hypothetical protein [Anaerotalea alkaliphila]NDL66784.1 hypothetical protein [Anaerotalea alkaliphila]